MPATLTSLSTLYVLLVSGCMYEAAGAAWPGLFFSVHLSPFVLPLRWLLLLLGVCVFDRKRHVCGEHSKVVLGISFCRFNGPILYYRQTDVNTGVPFHGDFDR